MTTYKCKLKISRLECEIYSVRTENHFCSKIVDEEQKSQGWAQKIKSVDLVETNNFFTPNIMLKCTQRQFHQLTKSTTSFLNLYSPMLFYGYLHVRKS